MTYDYDTATGECKELVSHKSLPDILDGYSRDNGAPELHTLLGAISSSIAVATKASREGDYDKIVGVMERIVGYARKTRDIASFLSHG